MRCPKKELTAVGVGGRRREVVGRDNVAEWQKRVNMVHYYMYTARWARARAAERRAPHVFLLRLGDAHLGGPGPSDR